MKYLITISVSQIANIESFFVRITYADTYAVILHNKQHCEPHYHIYLRYIDFPLSTHMLSHVLCINESNIICINSSERDIVSYMLSLNLKPEYQYQLSDLTTNMNLRSLKEELCI